MLTGIANHLWQSTLFAAAAWLLTLAWRKNRAAVRYLLWLAASVKFLIPFSLLVSLGSHLEWRTPRAVARALLSLAMPSWRDTDLAFSERSARAAPRSRR